MLCHDVRTYWSPEAVTRVTGWKPEGAAAERGFIHLDQLRRQRPWTPANPEMPTAAQCMKPFWEMTQADADACLAATDWCPASLPATSAAAASPPTSRRSAEMPVTMLRTQSSSTALGPVLQIAEGYHRHPARRGARRSGQADRSHLAHHLVRSPPHRSKAPSRDVYSVMANWGANHGVTVYGHVGAELVTLASMLRIPVAMHNVPEEKVLPASQLVRLWHPGYPGCGFRCLQALWSLVWKTLMDGGRYPCLSKSRRLSPRNL